MAGVKDTGIFSTRFSTDSLSPLQWQRQPAKHQTAASQGEGLRLFMDEDSDFFQKTYYDPPLLNDNGHILYLPVSTEKVVMETTFEIDAGRQFDQGGLMVYADTNCWVKTGIEWVDGQGQLSCVVTNTYSDWSVQAWPSNTLSIRVFRLGSDFVVERKHPTEDKWDFIRIFHLNIGKTQEVRMGVFACAPKQAGGSVLFKYLDFKHTEGYHHSAE